MADASIVTLLFTDLVGSTEQLERVGDDAAEELRRTHFGLLRDAATWTVGSRTFEMRCPSTGSQVPS